MSFKSKRPKGPSVYEYEEEEEVEPNYALGVNGYNESNHMMASGHYRREQHSSNSVMNHDRSIQSSQHYKDDDGEEEEIVVSIRSVPRYILIGMVMQGMLSLVNLVLISVILYQVS